MNFKKSCIASLVAVALSTGAIAAEKTVGQTLDDAQREGRIYASYALNRHLNPFDFKVVVNGSQAVLSGAVDDKVDKELAEQIALSVKGITKVDNRIEVDQNAEVHRAKPGERNFSGAVEDATITAGVKSKLLWNSSTDGLDIHVDTNNGLVTLTGKADSEESKELAGYLAANTEGVRDVDNRLAVAAGTSSAAKAEDAGAAVSDAWITTKVKSSFLYSKYVAASDIKVTTDHGLVTLAGEVNADSEKDLAVKLAKSIRGVKKVNADGLKVRS
jgi:osmotically-inducible protein OsmY